jgi:hypothetical protein
LDEDVNEVNAEGLVALGAVRLLLGALPCEQAEKINRASVLTK